MNRDMEQAAATFESAAERIISKFGGISAMTRTMGYDHASRIQGWKERGRIPTDIQPDVMAKAAELGIKLDWPDFHWKPTGGKGEAAA